MEIIKIGKDSFKISLTADEAQKYDFATNENCNEDNMTKSLRELIDRIKENNEMDFGKDKISAEIYISKDGGCEIFVSRAPSAKAIPKSTRPETKATYRFEELKSLLSVCHRLDLVGYKNWSCVHYNKQANTYYLTISGIYPKDLKYAFITEYGARVKSNLLPYITEHCKCICENNAIEIFSKLL